MRKLLLMVTFLTLGTLTAAAGIQPKYDAFIAQYSELTAMLNARKASLKNYSSLKNQLESARQAMYAGQAKMERQAYYVFADQQQKKLDAVRASLK